MTDNSEEMQELRQQALEARRHIENIIKHLERDSETKAWNKRSIKKHSNLLKEYNKLLWQQGIHLS
jgi:hypothetical protein